MRKQTGIPSQHNSDKFRFRRAAFYQNLKNKVGLAAAKAAALRINVTINLNINGSGIVAPPMRAPSRAPLLLPILLSHNLPSIPFPRVHSRCSPTVATACSSGPRRRRGSSLRCPKYSLFPAADSDPVPDFNSEVSASCVSLCLV